MSDHPSPLADLKAKLKAAQGESCRRFWAERIFEFKNQRGDYALVIQGGIDASMREALVMALVREV